MNVFLSFRKPQPPTFAYLNLTATLGRTDVTFGNVSAWAASSLSKLNLKRKWDQPCCQLISALTS